MRKILVSIIFCIATGLLFAHQHIIHHHHEDEIVSNHSEHHDDDSDSDHLPPHHIADHFSLDNAFPHFVKPVVQNVYHDLNVDLSISPVVEADDKKELLLIDTGPPVTKYYKHFPLRAPPIS